MPGGLSTLWGYAPCGLSTVWGSAGKVKQAAGLGSVPVGLRHG